MGRGYGLHILVAFLFFFNLQVSGQEKKPHLLALKARETMVIDGLNKESIWQKLTPANNFFQYFPSDTSMANGQTEVYITYDDRNIYILAKCYDELDGDYQTASLRRDYRGGGNDGLSFLIDTYQDNTNAFIFGVNPYGVLREGLISNGGQGRDSYSLAWDNKWRGEATIHDGYWMAELEIPLKTLRYKDNSKAWNMNFYRIDTKYNERSTWNHIPRNNIIFNLAFMGEVEFEEPLTKPGGNWSVIPYVSVNGAQDKLADTDAGEKAQDYGYGVGGDVKVAVSPALNLDLTINPDFSQVEVDRQVTNLSRFEIFFPERRQFFLENADLFGSFGNRRSRPFFSRRIGITRDTLTGQNISEPIYFGARLSGKASKNLRVGLLSMQTAPVEEANQPSLNYSVAVLQQKVFARSNIAAIFVNKQDFMAEESPSSDFEYNRTMGLEYNLASANNVWTGKAFYQYSAEPDNPDSTYSYAAFLSYNKRSFSISAGYQEIGNNYNAEVGFVPRKGFQRFEPRIQFTFFPVSNIINRYSIQLESEVLWSSLGFKSDHQFQLGFNMNFQNTSNFNINLVEEFTRLINDFDPTRTGGEPLPGGSSYTYRYLRGSFRTDERKRFVMRLNGSGGEFFNGTRYSLGGNVNYRFQPYGNIGVDVQYNNIDLPEPHNSADLLLIGPRVDVTFTKKLFITGLFQYNNQIDNFSTNVRLQWRYKPVSDLYIVYTDNYYASDFTTKNRSLVFKLTYWLNL